MPLAGPKVAEEIKKALGFSTKPTSPQTAAMANAIVAHTMTGIVAFLPGTITGIVNPAGGEALQNGAGMNGKITLVPAGLEGLLMAAIGAATPEIKGMANAITTHIMLAGVVSFKAGSITGTCTNVGPPTPAPGPLTLGMGTNGIIEGLNGAEMACLIATALKQAVASPEISSMCDAVCKHIMDQAKVTLPLVVGVCNPLGTLDLGAASGGIIA